MEISNKKRDSSINIFPHGHGKDTQILFQIWNKYEQNIHIDFTIDESKKLIEVLQQAIGSAEQRIQNSCDDD